MRHRLLRAICIALLPLLLSACWQDAPPVESSLLPQEEEPSDTGSLSLPEQFSLAYAPGESLDPITCATWKIPCWSPSAPAPGPPCPA